MTWYGFVLFLHIGVAIVAFMIAGVLHASLNALPRVRTVQEMRPFAHLVHRLEPLLPITALLLLGLGAWLIHLSGGAWDWSDGWILTAVIALVIIEGLAGAVLAPRSKALVASIEAAPDGAVSADLRNATLNPFIWDIAHIATVAFLGVVLVMASKPSGGLAVLIVVVGAAVGVALSRWQIAMASRPGALTMPGQRGEAATQTTTPA